MKHARVCTERSGEYSGGERVAGRLCSVVVTDLLDLATGVPEHTLQLRLVRRHQAGSSEGEEGGFNWVHNTDTYQHNRHILAHTYILTQKY
jgi:hypothetical protein